MSEDAHLGNGTPGLKSLRRLHLMVVLRDLVEERGRMRAAEDLGISYQTLVRCLKSGRMTQTMERVLERMLLSRRRRLGVRGEDAGVDLPRCGSLVGGRFVPRSRGCRAVWVGGRAGAGERGRGSSARPWDSDGCCAVLRREVAPQPPVQEYLASRGIDLHSAMRLGLGYSSGHGLRSFLESAGFCGERIGGCGLFVDRELERFAGMVVVPDVSGGGLVRWFAGRAVDPGVVPRFQALPGPKPVLGLGRLGPAPP